MMMFTYQMGDSWAMSSQSRNDNDRKSAEYYGREFLFHVTTCDGWESKVADF